MYREACVLKDRGVSLDRVQSHTNANFRGWICSYYENHAVVLGISGTARRRRGDYWPEIVDGHSCDGPAGPVRWAARVSRKNPRSKTTHRPGKASRSYPESDASRRAVFKTDRQPDPCTDRPTIERSMCPSIKHRTTVSPCLVIFFRSIASNLNKTLNINKNN